MQKRNTDNTDAGENMTIRMVFTGANNCSPHMKTLSHVLNNTNLDREYLENPIL